MKAVAATGLEIRLVLGGCQMAGQLTHLGNWDDYDVVVYRTRVDSTWPFLSFCSRLPLLSLTVYRFSSPGAKR